LICHLTNDSSTRPMLYSQLSGIHLGCQYGTYFDHALYLKMLQSRWNAEDRRLAEWPPHWLCMRGQDRMLRYSMGSMCFEMMRSFTRPRLGGGGCHR
jgi:hypothetical protein